MSVMSVEGYPLRTTVHYRQDAFGCHCYEKINEMRQLNQLSDVTITADDGMEFTAHRLVLAASSAYFRAMFTSDMMESRADSVRIQGIDSKTMGDLIEFSYSGSIAITVDNVQLLLFGASMLQLEPVCDACAEFLMSLLTPSNCLGIKRLAYTLGCTDLRQAADKYLCKNFNEVSQSDEFLQIDKASLVDMLSREDLQVRSEEQVFEAAIRWVRADVTDRSCFLSEVLSQVRLPLLSPHFLKDSVASDPLIHDDLRCRDLVDEAKDYHLLPDRRSQMQTPRTVPRRCSNENGVIYAVGGLSSSGDSLNSVEIFCPFEQQWSSGVTMNTLRSRVGVTVFDYKLYAIGGYDGGQRLNSMECYDPSIKKWTSLTSMHTRRSAVGCAAMDGKIYVVGGYDGTSSLSSIEVYDIKTNRWRFLAAMSTSRSAAGLCVYQGQLQVLGGHDGLSIFNSVEQYSIIKNQWSPATPMLARRCRLGVAVLNGKMYAVGGYDGSSFLSSVEVFDASVHHWTSVSCMTTSRSRVGVAVVGTKIYAVGGYNGLSNLNTVEQYDTEHDEWHLVTPMSIHQGGVGVGVLPRMP